MFPVAHVDQARIHARDRQGTAPELAVVEFCVNWDMSSYAPDELAEEEYTFAWKTYKEIEHLAALDTYLRGPGWATFRKSQGYRCFCRELRPSVERRKWPPTDDEVWNPL